MVKFRNNAIFSCKKVAKISGNKSSVESSYTYQVLQRGMTWLLVVG